MNEARIPRIAGVTFAGQYRLDLLWENGKTMAVDLRESVHRLKGLRALRDQAMFARAAVGDAGHSVVWPGDLDMGANRLLEMALEQNGHADAVEFIRWRWKNGLSLSAAAEAIGISRRLVAYFASGEKSVPRYVLLACKGWEAERRAAA